MLLLTLSAHAFGAPIAEIWHCDSTNGFNSYPIIADFTNEHKLEIGVASPRDGAFFLLDLDGSLHQKSARFRALTNFTAATARNAERPGMFAFEDATGAITLENRAENAAYTVQLDGEPAPGTGLLFGDINADGVPELLAVRRDGVITVFDRFLNPRWQFDAGAPLEAPLAVAPVFNIASAVYCVTTDGVLHAFTGTGRPFWQFAPVAPDRHATPDGPLVLQLAAERPSVLYTNDSGCVYAVDAIKGREQWHTQLANGPLGTPAIIEYSPAEGRRIVTVSQAGQITMLDVNGQVKTQSHLPAGNYVPRPLVADIDGDDNFEVLVANAQWEILVAALDGTVKRTIPLQGNAAGMILAGLDGKGYLDLLVATDCARLYRFSTKATDGWLHPRANNTLNGFMLPITVIPLPPPEAARRPAHAQPAVARDFVKQQPYTSAVICPRPVKGMKYASVVLRQQHTVLGSSYKQLDNDGMITIPFVETLDADLTYDLGLYDRQGKILASSAAVPVSPPLVKLIDLPPTGNFTQALAERGNQYAIPQRWADFTKTGSDAEGPQVVEQPRQQIGGDSGCALMQLAFRRGVARQSDGPPWGVKIASSYQGAFPIPSSGGEKPELAWAKPNIVTGPACGHSASLLYRLAMAAQFAGAAAIDLDGDNAPVNEARAKWLQFTQAHPARGIPFTPLALMLGTPGVAVNAATRHVFGWNGPIGFEQEFLTCGPYGNVFDLIAKDASPPALQSYGVIWPVGQFPLSREQIETLIQYVKSGGILVLDATTARAFPATFTGINIAQSPAIGSQVQTALGPMPLTESPRSSAPFRYLPMTVDKKTEIVAWTDAGAPFLAWRQKDDGIVIVSATEQWIDERGNWLPSSALLLKTIVSAFVPVQPPVTAPMFINRLPDGWLVGLINNAGIAKAPTTPPVIDPAKEGDAGRWEADLRLNRQIPLQFETLSGEFEWNNKTAGLHARIAPGEIGAVKIITQR